MDCSNSKWTIINSMNKFAFKLFKVFASRHQHDSKNMCFSPLEVFNSLVMLLIGAKGITESQLEDMLCLKQFNNPKCYQELIDLIKWIIKSNHEIMVYGTVIYVDQKLQLVPDYLEKVKNIFEIKPKPMDFSKIIDSVYTINKDAYEMTDGIIEGVISVRDLQEDNNVKLIISNAVFFRGYWLFKFDNIHKEKFYYSCGQKSAQVDMMSHIGQHRYYYDHELKAQTVSIAYSSSDIRMVMILPDQIDSEAVYLIDLLDDTMLTKIFWRLQNKAKSTTELIIPRFALDAHKVSLQKSVKQMGAKSIYDHETAELNGICANDRIHLTKLVHKAFILVDERGSKEAQIKSQETRFMKPSKSNKQNDQNETIIKFQANHPFVFIILDKITGVVCFMGVFADPTEILEVVNEQNLSNEQISQLLADSENDPKEFTQSLDSTSSTTSSLNL